MPSVTANDDPVRGERVASNWCTGDEDAPGSADQYELLVERRDRGLTNARSSPAHQTSAPSAPRGRGRRRPPLERGSGRGVSAGICACTSGPGQHSDVMGWSDLSLVGTESGSSSKDEQNIKGAEQRQV